MKPARATLQVRAPMGQYIARVLEESGFAGYEPETTSCFLAAMEVRPAGSVFDIGANVGAFALLAAALTDRTVIAFEPAPDLAETARQLIELNALRCRVEEIALGAEAGIADLYLSNVTDASNSLRRGFRPSSRTVSVTVRTLDEYCTTTLSHPSLLKIDTESTEPDVLRGGLEVLTRDRPWVICEVLAGRTEAELMRVLAPLGYAWYHITEKQPLRRRKTIVGDPTYRSMNWLFTPEPPGRAFWSARARWLDAVQNTVGRGGT